MKTLLLSLALVAAPAFAAEVVEIDSQGCMFSPTRGMCVVSNKLPFDANCEVSVIARTVGKQRVIVTRKVLIPAKHFETIEVFSTQDKPIRDVTANGTCTVQ